MTTPRVEHKGQRVVVTIAEEHAREVWRFLLGRHIAATVLDEVGPSSVVRMMVNGHTLEDVEYALAEWELIRWWVAQ